MRMIDSKINDAFADWSTFSKAVVSKKIFQSAHNNYANTFNETEFISSKFPSQYIPTSAKLKETGRCKSLRKALTKQEDHDF